MGHWNCKARYADGFEIERNMPYTANGNYYKENEEQQEYEEYLLSAHKGCVWYSVVYDNEKAKQERINFKPSYQY